MDCKDDIRSHALAIGAFRCGFATAIEVDQDAQDAYARWLAQGKNASMDYCSKYLEVRNDPRLLLEGANTVISCAFCYHTGANSPHIASYALGDDYHYVIKGRLAALGQFITQKYGGEVRPLVDTAPLRERYWAQKAGIGFIGLNNQLIIPGAGSYFFLGELLWTGCVAPDEPINGDCGACGACLKACPNGALDGLGTCDARKCISYLTIEHRGDLPIDASLQGNLYGCDICQRACPHNAAPPISEIPEFSPHPDIMALQPHALATMTPSRYKKITAHSAMRRAPYQQLMRNMQKNADDKMRNVGKI